MMTHDVTPIASRHWEKAHNEFLQRGLRPAATLTWADGHRVCRPLVVGCAGGTCERMPLGLAAG